MRDATTLLRELRALLKTAQEVAFELEQIGAGEGSRPSSPVAPDGPEQSDVPRLKRIIAWYWRNKGPYPTAIDEGGNG